MKPTSTTVAAIIAALLADEATFGGSGANNPYELRMGVTSITPGDMTEFVEASYGGYAAWETEAGFTDGYDGILQRRAMTLLPPEGGFVQHANSSMGALNQTLRSWSIFNVAENDTIACGNLPQEIPVTVNGQQITVPNPQVTLDAII